MPQEMKKKAVRAAGIIFVVLGLFGFVLPFLQGFLFLAIGLILLSLYSPGIRARMSTYTERHPKLHARMHHIREWVTGIIERL